MATRATKFTSFEQARREHELLEKRLDQLKLLLEQRQITLKEVVRSLEGLRRFAAKHFQKEESGGFFETVVDRAPHLSRLADKLSHEHFEMLELIDRLIFFARRGTDQLLFWYILNHRFCNFIDKLRQHESEENGLLQMAYSDDLGTKD